MKVEEFNDKYRIKDLIIKRINDPSGNRYYAGEKEDVRLWTYPSVTTILGAVYPSGYYLEKWIRDNGEHGRIEFEKSADQGTEVHMAIEALLQGREVPVYEDMPNKVKRGIQAFIDWYFEFKPKVIATEQIVFNDEYQYAGACDFVCELNYSKGKTEYKGIYVIDFKTSNSLHKQHELQDVAYLKALGVDGKAALLHLGNRTKAGYSFKEIDVEENWEQFKHFKKTYDMMFPNSKPSEKQYPEFFIIPELNQQ